MARQVANFGKKPVKSGFYNDPENHPAGGGTCDKCGQEVEPGDYYDPDFDSTRDYAADAIYKRLTGKDFRPVDSLYQFAQWLSMDEDELFDVITDIVSEAFGDDSYYCHDCMKNAIEKVAFAWVEDNYEVDPIQNSRKMKHIKSCNCGKCRTIKSSAPHGENGPYTVYEEGDDFKGYLNKYGELSDREDADEFDMYDDAVAELDGIKDLLYSYDEGTEVFVTILDSAENPVFDIKYTVIGNDVKETILNGCGKKKKATQKVVKSTRKVVKSSVDWSEYDTPEADAINEKYLPAEGEGDTKATQAVTAVNKLIYQWYNNGEVYDNRGGFGSTANGCDTYANWLANHIDGTESILDGGCDTSFEGRYEDGLKKLFDFIFDEALLEQLNMEPKEDTIYENDDNYDNMFSVDHESCSECGEDVTDDSRAFDPEQGGGELDEMVWKELARYDGFDDIMTYSYGFYEPDDEHNDLYDLYNDWYSEWYRNRDNTMLCRDCAERAAEEAAEYISDHYDWEDDEGYDKRTGLDEEGYNREGYDEEGFNREGIDDEGYDREGYDASGRNREGYDREGYDEQGLDARGLGKDRKMGSDKALKHFLGVDKDEDIGHDYDYYRRR